MNLADVLRLLEPTADGGYTLEIPAGWHQGRTLYGGLNLALAARSAALAIDDLGPLRAAQVTFMAPLGDRARFVPTLLRQGASMSFVAVDADGGGTLATRTLLTYGRARDTPVAHDRLRAPDVPGPDSCPPVPLDPPRTPVFFAEMELRFAAGTPPLSGGEPTFALWVRHRGAAQVDPLIGLLAVADVLPPAVLGSLREMRPASSVAWDLEVVGEPVDPTGWYLLEVEGEYAASGYAAQAMRCFDAERRPLTVGRQSVAYF